MNSFRNRVRSKVIKNAMQKVNWFPFDSLLYFEYWCAPIAKYKGVNMVVDSFSAMESKKGEGG